MFVFCIARSYRASPLSPLYHQVSALFQNFPETSPRSNHKQCKCRKENASSWNYGMNTHLDYSISHRRRACFKLTTLNTTPTHGRREKCPLDVTTRSVHDLRPSQFLILVRALLKDYLELELLVPVDLKRKYVKVTPQTNKSEHRKRLRNYT